jgi:hypothetical protein
MSLVRALRVAGALVAFAGAFLVADRAQAADDTDPPSILALAYFAGTWTCESAYGNPVRKVYVAANGGYDLENTWGPPSNPTQFVNHEHYDAAKGSLRVRSDAFASDGTRLDFEGTSMSWNGTTLTFTGTLTVGDTHTKIDQQMVYQQLDADTFQRAFLDGPYHRLASSETCRRVRAPEASPTPST